MKTRIYVSLTLLLCSIVFSCKKNPVINFSTNLDASFPHQHHRSGPPNIIFLLADDMGYEMPTFDGGGSYNTPHLDSLAANSMVFNHCEATPLCSPSRVELLSGVYNFRNYLKLGWANYDINYISYANVLQQNG